MELWKEQRRDNNNPHAVLRGKELGNLLEMVKPTPPDGLGPTVAYSPSLTATGPENLPWGYMCLRES